VSTRCLNYLVLSATLFVSQTFAATLEGYATLPANTIMPGPDSGQFIEADASIQLPFKGQPAQGFSAIIADDNGGFLALVDNGFGSRENSPDFLLRVYFITPDFRTVLGGTGEIQIDGYINLSDPHEFMPYPITASRGCLPESEPCITTAPSIQADRLLTGADLDPESLQVANDGTIWVGDEFGPFLVHFDAAGSMLEAPFDLTGLNSESRPGFETSTATVRRSRGFEGMGISVDGNTLFPMLEGPMLTEEGLLNIYSFDIENRKFTNTSANTPSYVYSPDPMATAVGAFKLTEKNSGIILERDSSHGAEARHKKIFRIDLTAANTEHVLQKTEWVDLLKIDDPNDLNLDGKLEFSLPMSTIEGFVHLENGMLAIITDNNFPFGRSRGPGSPEATEFIIIKPDSQPMGTSGE
jgi:hypothetical protein